MKKFIVFFCLGIILFHFVQIIYSQRALFIQNYDVKYWKDRFEHSQWTLPLSKRIIGDDGLFAYIGYDLISGGSITGFDSEVPPLGKYLIGASIKVFNNPLYYSVFFGLGSLVLFYAVGVKVLNSKVNSLIATSMLFLDPLFFSQFWKSMLDISQLFFLLLNVLFIILIFDSKKQGKKNIFLLSLLAGISLGFFAQIKYPMLIPVIFFLETIVFFVKKIKSSYIVFLIGSLIAVLFVNLNFFLDGRTLIEFLKFQKYVLAFYTKSQLAVHNEAIWSSFFLGKFPEINGARLVQVEEWSLVWPLTGIVAIWTSVSQIFRKNNKIWKGLALFILLSFLIYSLLPIYPRYLLLLFPFMYLFFIAKLFKSFPKIANAIFIIIILYGLLNSRNFIQDNPNKILNSFYYNFSNQYFQDVYQENIANLPMTRREFRLTSQTALNDAGVKAIKIHELSKDFYGSHGKVKLSVEYFTQDLGTFSEFKELSLSKINGKWKIDWDWNLILNGYSSNFVIKTDKILGKRGSIIQSGKILAQDSNNFIVSVNPEKIDLKRENEMLKFISLLGDVKAPHLQNAYLENALPGEYIPLVTLFFLPDKATQAKLLSFPGLKILPYPSRIYEGVNQESLGNTVYKECCTRIYSKNYHGIEGLEKEYDLVLSGADGGSITIRDKMGNIVKTVVERETKIGQDVRVGL